MLMMNLPDIPEGRKTPSEDTDQRTLIAHSQIEGNAGQRRRQPHRHQRRQCRRRSIHDNESNAAKVLLSSSSSSLSFRAQRTIDASEALAQSSSRPSRWCCGVTFVCAHMLAHVHVVLHSRSIRACERVTDTTTDTYTYEMIRTLCAVRFGCATEYPSEATFATFGDQSTNGTHTQTQTLAQIAPALGSAAAKASARGQAKGIGRQTQFRDRIGAQRANRSWCSWTGLTLAPMAAWRLAARSEQRHGMFVRFCAFSRSANTPHTQTNVRAQRPRLPADRMRSIVRLCRLCVRCCSLDSHRCEHTCADQLCVNVVRFYRNRNGEQCFSTRSWADGRTDGHKLNVNSHTQTVG